MTPLIRAGIASIAFSVVFYAGYAYANSTERIDLRTDANFLRAKEAIAAKDWERASYYLKYVRSEDPEVYNLRGYSFRHLGKFDEAFRNYKIALDTDPNHRGAHEYVGEAYLMTNNLPMAEQHLAALERICGKNCEEYNDLAHEISEYKKKH
jgi:Flp pilus assembly protein TadD